MTLGWAFKVEGQQDIFHKLAFVVESLENLLKIKCQLLDSTVRHCGLIHMWYDWEITRLC